MGARTRAGLGRRTREELGLAADPQWWELQPGEPVEDWQLRCQGVLAATWHCVEVADWPPRRAGQPAHIDLGPAIEAHVTAVGSRLRAIDRCGITDPEAG